ncbi:hypothetical protein [Ascidiimonas sp. W6]|uniref:hypothetical protein n=1 Tax=Ascidiimonas meishanensis TaxID=3128903 RepID=UPI0030EDFA70
MVIKSFHTYLKPLIDFYTEVYETSESTIDKKSALKGINGVQSIQKEILKYEKKQQKKHLKVIYNQLSNLSRGIEFFENFETNEQHNALGIHIYTMQEKIEKELNW